MALNCEHPVDGEPDGTCASCVGDPERIVARRPGARRGLQPRHRRHARPAVAGRARHPGPVEGVHRRRGPPADGRRVQRPAQDPRGAAGPRRVRAGHHRPPEGPADDPSRTQHFEFRLLASEILSACSPTSTSRPASASPPTPSTWSSAGATARPATPSPPSTRWRRPARSTTRRRRLRHRRGHRRPRPAAGLVAVAEALGRGRDPRRLAIELLEHLRNGFLATQARSLSCCPTTAAASRGPGPPARHCATVVRAMEVIGEAAGRHARVGRPPGHPRGGPGPPGAPAADPSPAALLERIERLEAASSGGAAPAGRRSAGAGRPRAGRRPSPPSHAGGGRRWPTAPAPTAPRGGRPVRPGAHRARAPPPALRRGLPGGRPSHRSRLPARCAAVRARAAAGCGPAAGALRPRRPRPPPAAAGLPTPGTSSPSVGATAILARSVARGSRSYCRVPAGSWRVDGCRRRLRPPRPRAARQGPAGPRTEVEAALAPTSAARSRSPRRRRRRVPGTGARHPTRPPRTPRTIDLETSKTPGRR